MKRLHDLKPPYPDRAYIWYTAVQQRRGASHLLIVPVITLDPARMPIPAQYRFHPERQQQWRRDLLTQGQDVAIPSVVMPSLALLWCSSRQEPRHWEHSADQYNNTARFERPRGYCQTCWNVVARNDAGIAANIRRLINAHRSGTLEPSADLNAVTLWREHAMRRLHVGR